MPVRYVKSFTSRLEDSDGKRLTQLLWGDPVHVTGTAVNGRIRARARGRPTRPPGSAAQPWGWVKVDDLAARNRLLEIYVIDVGQGDSVLLRTPNDRWHLIDGGVAAAEQMTKKGSANFVRWKFLDDLRRPRVELESVILSHPDSDHFGGLTDLFRGKVPLRPEPFEVKVGRFFHSGIANWKANPKLGDAVAGEVAPFPVPNAPWKKRSGEFVQELLDDRASFANPPRPLATEYAELAELVATVPETARRLSRDDAFLPGYGPGDGAGVVIHILGPIVETLTSGERGLRVLGDQGITKNGHSIVLRADIGDVRVLLTGDLNSRSQRLLLSYLPAGEFTSDVAKACHHGAEDVEIDFVKAMAARATVISSGDDEVHAHPRPVLMGASAHYGREAVDEEGRSMPPLIYSTELARSVSLCFASGVRVRDGDGEDAEARQVAVERTQVRPDRRNAFYRKLSSLPVSNDLVYGLVNIRTDGTHVLCATMEEAGTEFDVKVFRGG